MEELKLVGDITNFNTTIIGSFKHVSFQEFEKKDFYILSKSNLGDLDISEVIIKEQLNLDTYLTASKLQNKILANILHLIDNGHKKLLFLELLTYVDTNVRNNLIVYLKENNIKFVNVTNDMEDTMFADYLVVLYADKVALEGKTLDVLNEERLLNRLGITLPFIIDLSIQLKYYGLVDKIYLSKEELVSALWK